MSGRWNAHELIPAAPVRELVHGLGVDLEVIAQRLAARSKNAEAWRRWLHHLPHRGTVCVWSVDELCVAFGEHLSLVDPLYREVAA